MGEIMRVMRMLTVDLELNYKHYAKDVGMIPYLLEKNHGWKCRIIGPENVDNFIRPYDDYNVETVIPDLRFRDTIKCVSAYIKKHAKEYDVLNLYHINTKTNLYFANLFHKYNPRGIIYLKLDLGFRGLEMCRLDSFIKHCLKKLLFRSMEVVSDENQEVCKQLEILYKKNIKYIPNGWYERPEIYIGEREIDYLYVGRIGIREKGVDILLEAFAHLKRSVNLHLVGKIEESFLDNIKIWKDKYPEARNRVYFHGEIRDKKKLNEIYDHSKILIVPSRWESFGIVLVEGLSHGCYIIASDAVSSANSILDNTIGSIFENERADSLCNCMSTVKMKEIDRKAIYNKASHYNWEKIVKDLSEILIRSYNEKNHI